MEDLCWNCASPLHHRRDCDRPRDPEIRQVIRKAHKMSDPRRNHEQYQKWQKKLSEEIKTLPSLKLYENEVNRLLQVLYEIKHDAADIPEEVTTVSADYLKKNLEKVEFLRKKLTFELEAVQLVGRLLKLYRLDSPQYEILKIKVAETQEQQRKLSDKLYVKFSTLKTASRVVLEFNDLVEEVMSYAEDGMEAFSGRPLQIPVTRRLWKAKKDALKSAQSLYEKYEYLFSSTAKLSFTERLESLKDAWTLLKSMKKESEQDLSKITCRICCDKDVEFVLTRCGHLFCGPCLNSINECAFCRGPSNEFVQMFFLSRRRHFWNKVKE